MHTFRDYYNNKVRLSFEQNPFSNEPWHVWVICRYKDQWLLTQHTERGLEFPGGKVELEETVSEAAIREVMEETGAIVDTLHYLGQYIVDGKSATIVKNVYFAEIEKLIQKATYYETEGPIILEKIPKSIKTNKAFSFIMKDEVLWHCLDEIHKKHELLQK